VNVFELSGSPINYVKDELCEEVVLTLPSASRISPFSAPMREVSSVIALFFFFWGGLMRADQQAVGK